MAVYNVSYRGSPVDIASKALIVLHGRGDTSHSFLSLVDTFCDDLFYVAAPQAPYGSWYPYSFMVDEALNEPDLSFSVENVKKLIEETSQYIPKHKIYIIGFSQGACLALEVASRFAAKYGGVIAFTGGLIGSHLERKKYRGDFEGTPVFMGNSDQDPHVPLIRSEQSKDLMEQLGARVTLKVYPHMGHTINEDEINWVKTNIFLNE